MNDKTENNLAAWRDSRNWTQEQLEEKTGIKKNQISRLEKGRRKLTIIYLNKIAEAYGVKPADLMSPPPLIGNTTATIATAHIDTAQVAAPAPLGYTGRNDLPIRGDARGGMDGFFFDNGIIQGYTDRPALLDRVPGAYAIRINGDSMVPALRHGWLAYVHPTMPIAPGDDVVVEMIDGQAFVKELVRRTQKHVIVLQHNPRLEIRHDTARIKSIHKIVHSTRTPA